MENKIMMQKGVLVVVLEGELDLNSAEGYRDAIDDAIMRWDAMYLVFDLSNVTFIDSSGLGMMLGRYKKIEQKGGRSAMYGICPRLSRMIEVSGLQKLMPVYKTREDAIEGV
ncbi:MAG: anti-sigma factor antagonist [Selenomonadales bacterium]|nr:anti-sigma factor antagonist [Selenomonadales bacterium]MBQ6713457.1 anti-sigma factor antagonist [Selenomonadales bacterium]